MFISQNVLVVKYSTLHWEVLPTGTVYQQQAIPFGDIFVGVYINMGSLCIMGYILALSFKCY